MKGKKLLEIALAAVVALGAVVPAYAADDETSNGKEEKSEEQIACEEKCERLEEEIKEIEEQMEIREAYYKADLLNDESAVRDAEKAKKEFMDEKEITGRKDLEDVVRKLERSLEDEEDENKKKEIKAAIEDAEADVEEFDRLEEDIDIANEGLENLKENYNEWFEEENDRLVGLKAVLKETRKDCPIGDEDEEEEDDNEGEVVEPTDGDDDTDDEGDENPEECKEKDATVVCEPKVVKAGVTPAKGDNPQTGVGSLVGLTATAVVAGAAAVANKKHNK